MCINTDWDVAVNGNSQDPYSMHYHGRTDLFKLKYYMR